MTISLIVAMAANRAIGKNGGLPWHLPPDLRRFKQLTMGHTLVVGRKTFESIGRPLPGRHMVVVTRQSSYAPAGVVVKHSLKEALCAAQGNEVFVGGGAEIFREALPLADRLYMTFIAAEVEGDTFFPEYEEAEWTLVSEEPHPPGDGAAFAYSFQLYERRATESTQST